MEFRLLLLSITLYTVYLLSTFAFAKEIYPRREVSFSKQRSNMLPSVVTGRQVKTTKQSQKTVSATQRKNIRTKSEQTQQITAPQVEQLSCKDIDVVYTWVNGTDPKFVRVFSKYRNVNPRNMRRVRDYNTLQFSVRSVEKNAPWIRKIHIVTNGQIPTWLDTSNKKFFFFSIYLSFQPTILNYFIFNHLSFNLFLAFFISHLFYFISVVFLSTNINNFVSQLFSFNCLTSHFPKKKRHYTY